MCVSCSSLHAVIPAGEAAVCTSPNGLSLVVKELQYFPIGLPVITRYYKNTWTWESLWSLSSQYFPVQTWQSCWGQQGGGMLIMDLPLQWGASARGVLLSSHCCIQNVMLVQLVNGDLLDWNMFTSNKNNLGSFANFRKALPSVQAMLAAPVVWFVIVCWTSEQLGVLSSVLYALDHSVKLFLSCSRFKFHRKERGKLLLISCSVLFCFVLVGFVFVWFFFPCELLIVTFLHINKKIISLRQTHGVESFSQHIWSLAKFEVLQTGSGSGRCLKSWSCTALSVWGWRAANGNAVWGEMDVLHRDLIAN